ncbi:MAG TPA: hypothetical protein VL490_08595 [Mucilaginibacter sp.]|nr:hypothetical protein [Mucilaginibacter sp.]
MKKPLMRFTLLFILGACLSLSASAQQLFTVKGIIFKKNTPVTIEQAVITNLNRKTTALSDDLGSFSIEAAIGDSLLFKKADYTNEYMVVLSRSMQSIYMQPVIRLNEVVIKDKSRQQELNDVMSDYKKKGQYYTLDPSVMSVLNSPLTGLYELFGKAPAQARRFRQFTKEDQERSAIAKRYNRQIVQQITKMPDTEVTDFMLAFTPSYEDIKIWSDYDIISYIKKSYQYFIHHKDALKIQKLY